MSAPGSGQEFRRLGLAISGFPNEKGGFVRLDRVLYVTEGDWQMVIAQILQLLSYGVAAVCLIDSHSETAKLFAASAGIAILLAMGSGSSSEDDGDDHDSEEFSEPGGARAAVGEVDAK